jgi:hypothetical protein
MKPLRFHPLAVFTAAIFVAATVANFLTLDWRRAPISYAIGSALLASPFAVFSLRTPLSGELAGATSILPRERRYSFFPGNEVAAPAE